MSKSLGNSPDPLDLIARYGADGLRFGLMLIAPKGQDILFSEERIEVGRNFMNKLWNSTRFVFMNLDNDIPLPWGERLGEGELTYADKWILSCLEQATNEINTALDGYQFDVAARTLYQFIWGEYCDWYIELAKTQLAEGDARSETTQKILVYVLSNIIRLLHPFAPFITEEIWQKLVVNQTEQATIMFDEYPKVVKKIEFVKEAEKMQLVMDVITAIRNIRGEHDIKPGKRINTTLIAHDKSVQKDLETNKNYITELAKIENLNLELNSKPTEEGATAVAGPVEVFVPFEGLIDIEEEKTRLQKEISKVEKYVDVVKKKLSNENFVSRAPEAVVAVERERLAASEKELKKLTDALKKLL